MDVKVLNSELYLKYCGGWETFFFMLTLVKSEDLGGCSPKIMQLGLSEGIDVTRGGSVSMSTNP